MTVPQTAPAPDSARPKSKSIEVYDFRRPTTLAREHARVLELAFETFARQWATQLTAKVRAKSTAVSDSLEMKTYDEYALSLPSTTAMVLCAVECFEVMGSIGG
jgi:flagellar motor switch protein FliM